jgi:transcriptional regulator with XRE-family HTH domain
VNAGEQLTFGDLLRRHRNAAGLTQEDLAERSGLSVDTISLLERGEHRRPHRYTMQSLADALGLSRNDEGPRGNLPAHLGGPTPHARARAGGRPAYLRLVARLSEALEVTEAALREARRLRGTT